MNHFKSIGFSVESDAEIDSLVERFLPEGEEHRTKHGRYFRYASPCGAELWFQVNSNDEVVGLTPYFAAETRIPVGLTHAVQRPGDTALEGGFHAWASPTTGHPETSGQYPFVFECPDYRLYGDVAFPALVEASVAAFAHELEFFSSVDEYDASQAEGPAFASQSFIPFGLFESEAGTRDTAPSQAIVTGHVRAAEMRTNAATGEAYLAAEIESVGGAFHVVSDPAFVGEPITVGGVLSGSFWLCGRLATKPPPRSTGLLRRLLKR